MFIPRTNGLLCRRVLCILCTKCTLHSNHRLTVWYSNTQNDFSPRATIFSLHTPVWPSGRNVNYDKKKTCWEKIFWSCSFYLYRFCKHVSRDFPIIIFFFNPGVHYETPCIFECINSTLKHLISLMHGVTMNIIFHTLFRLFFVNHLKIRPGTLVAFRNFKCVFGEFLASYRCVACWS